MYFMLVSCFLLLASAALASKNVGDEIINGITPDMLAEEQGFILQKYTIETEDGYLISLWRFNDAENTLSDKELSERIPVLSVHGIFDTGTFPMYNQRDNSMAYVMFDEGYDMWSISLRGTTYSLGHKTYDSAEDDEYWDFGIGELARYDLMKAIDFILENSTHDSLFLAAHSMGTSTVQALMTSHERWNFDTSKVRAIMMLAPAIHIKDIQSAFLEDFIFQDESWLRAEARILFGSKSVFAHEGLIAGLPDFCHLFPGTCKDGLSYVAGTNPNEDNIPEDRMYVYMNYYPAGSSEQALEHLIEILKRDVFADYDYDDEEENIAHYGTSEPPLFDAANYPKDVPLYIIYGGHDDIIVKEDVEMFIDDMKAQNLNDFRYKLNDDYCHADFCFGMDAREGFLNDMIDFFAEYN